MKLAASACTVLNRANLYASFALLATVASARATELRVAATFPSTGVTRIVLRASAAEGASLVTVKSGDIHISGVPSGGAPGYHPADPVWKETPPSEWGLGFVAKRFGAILVISTRNEVQVIHHHYTLEALRLSAPRGVTVVRELRSLGDSGAPDLKAP